MEIVDNSRKYSKNDVFHIFTVTSFIELVEEHQSSLLQYWSSPFI
jgi:hypothetical protein